MNQSLKDNGRDVIQDRTGTKERLRVAIHGAVQGVGFRPFIYQLATGLGLEGWVRNSVEGVLIEVEGARKSLEDFRLRIEKEKPPHAIIQSLESSFLDPKGLCGFEIQESEEEGEKIAFVLPDIATCQDCLNEIFDPDNRRYRYPFTNCTHCGPRFSIIEALPYDRSRTSMKSFRMCSPCKAEYKDARDRRFHAQPNACPTCGPHLEWWDGQGQTQASHHEALFRACTAIREGEVVAVKGLGGFHLMADARNEEAVNRLRLRKGRDEKPFAVMFPSLEMVKAECEVSELEERILLSPESPIVLLSRKSSSLNSSQVVSAVAPRNPYLGVMLPYTPLHHIIMRELAFPVIATSGNFSDEVICFDEREVMERLAGIADHFLVHDRGIVRHVDDSIVRIVKDRELVLRRARGFAPLPVVFKEEEPSALAVGAHLKNTVAVSKGNRAFVSQHIGDLETSQTYDAFLRVISSFRWLYDLYPEKVACDLHPDYLSTRFARLSGFPVTQIQHHFAHILSCMAENEIEGPVLGVSWDGTGYGLDQTVWGGEFLAVDGNAFERIAHFRTFTLPGGERAVKETRRSALGLLYPIYGDLLFSLKELPPVQSFSPGELEVLRRMLKRQVNTPLTSSAGRLFDAVASIVGISQINRFEGQAPMELEFAIGDRKTSASYPLQVRELPVSKRNGPGTGRKFGLSQMKYVVDWEPMVCEIIQDVRLKVSHGIISAKFHNTLAEAIVAIAERVARKKVVLSGGCFQNRYLTERAIDRLRDKGFRPYWHQRIPPNDGGIALGQLVAISVKGGKDRDVFSDSR